MSDEKQHAPGVVVNATAGKAYCGRKTKTTSSDWKLVTCGDCNAAHRADEEAK